MTTEEIDSMPAGREMDKLIAEKVMRFKVEENGQWQDTGEIAYSKVITMGGISLYQDIPPYSTDISTAMDILNHVGYKTVYIWWNDSGTMWQVYLDYSRRVSEDCRFHACDDDDNTDENNLALAICRAALKSKL